MLIEAALNGGRTREENSAVPITADELAASASEAVAAGAGALHFHVRGQDGRESVAPDDVAAAVSAVRHAVPSTPLGVSTGAWILHNVLGRYEAVSAWQVLPDFASVNFKEEGATELAQLLLSRGIGIEAGFSDMAGAQVLVASGLALRCLRVLVEPFEQDTKSFLVTLEALEAVLDRARITLPRLLHGMDRVVWDAIDLAAARGYDTRIGFEDTLTLPDASLAGSNAALVAETIRRSRRASSA